VRAEAHDVFLDAENLEILQIHLVDRVELGGELLRRAIDVRVVHVERAHAHEAEQFARLLVAVAGAVFGQAQRQIAVTARLRRKNAVMMRAVHRFEVIALEGFAPRPFSRRAAALVFQIQFLFNSLVQSSSVPPSVLFLGFNGASPALPWSRSFSSQRLDFPFNGFALSFFFIQVHRRKHRSA
jgi:hypothetical protein